MTTIENNRIIAEFMGARPIKFMDGEFGLTFWIEEDVEGRYGRFPNGSTNVVESENFGRFHKSWDWLMAVVDKIESEHPISVIISCGNCEIYDCEKQETLIFEEGAKMTAVYKAVVEFIKSKQ